MKKVFGIVLALGLVLAMVVAAGPAGAVSPPITVKVVPPIGGASANYTILFHNDGTLLGADGDTIDIMFPVGTDSSFCNLGEVTVTKGPSAVAATEAVTITAVTNIGTRTLRLVVETGFNITKCEWVKIVCENITNPKPCYHTLQVGTSAHSPVVSEEYKIYLVELDLCKGWNLISLPGIPEDPAIEVVLADLLTGACCEDPIEFSVWYYDCGTWYVYNNGGYATLTEMHDGAAYWIKTSAAAKFKIKGIWYPEPPGPPLKYCYHECWNMVGFTSGTAMTPDVYMATLSPAGSVFYVLEYDCTAGWNALNMTVDTMDPGQGYWMAFAKDACFAPPPA